MSLPSASVQHSELISSNNAALISTFLMGSYTIVYLETLYIYPAAQFGIQWYTILFNLPQSKSNSVAAYVSLFEVPLWITIAMEVTSFAMYIVADGLLIWRCYHVYGGLRRIIILPLFLLAVEVGLVVTSIIYFLIVDSDPSQHEIDTSNDIQSGVFFASFATSLSTTVLIAHRIYTSSRNINGAKKRFIRIIEIIIQSAAVYSAVLLITAISDAIPDGDSWPSPAIFALANYSSSLLVPTAGMAPTIMAARVCLASSKEEDTMPEHPELSQLEFRGRIQSSTHADTRIDFRFGDANSIDSHDRGSEDKIELA
ncbi:hypothetical protein CVT25_012390 [Psilocybe cyanescens]|uniref:Uncharacterized protein n=1 Tax=Psilocybe cyanescens TaxID=93625 RepID=A0A409X7S0_PSICY|nr:hypothetical protein CVT25_012390 [Psilocybe cyanescens]